MLSLKSIFRALWLLAKIKELRFLGHRKKRTSIFEHKRFTWFSNFGLQPNTFSYVKYNIRFAILCTYAIFAKCVISLRLIRLWYPKVETVFKNSNLELVFINNRNSTVIKTCFYSKKLQSCKNYSWLQMCSSFRQISEKTSVVEHQEIF